MEWDRKNIIGGVIVIAASNALSSLNAFYPEFRADGFTGLDAKKMEEKLRDEHDRDCSSIRKDLNEFAVRINLNEYILGECKKHVDDNK